jgi:uncharacterized protein YehS (DUF1456 family)
MQTNDVLRRLRYALDLRDAQLTEMMNHWEDPVTVEHVTALLRPDGHPEIVDCTDRELERALDGLIIARRGPRDPTHATPAPREHELTNNTILKKLRIAMSYREGDMLTTLAAGGMTVTAPELGALFRKPSHRHFRHCGDQLLRGFLVGLALQART